MPNICILTESTALYAQSNFPGHERVHVIPFDIQNTTYQEGTLFPGDVIVQKQLIPPAPQEFIQFYARLSQPYDSILVITLASLLNPATQHALLASEQYNNGATVEVIDSQTTYAFQRAHDPATPGNTAWPRLYRVICNRIGGVEE